MLAVEAEVLIQFLLIPKERLVVEVLAAEETLLYRQVLVIQERQIQAVVAVVVVRLILPAL